MDSNTIERLRHFISDRVTSEAVYTFLRTALEKPNGTFEVSLLAAERLAMMALKSAWKDLENLAPTTKEDEKPSTNIGL